MSHNKKYKNYSNTKLRKLHNLIFGFINLLNITTVLLVASLAYFIYHCNSYKLLIYCIISGSLLYYLHYTIRSIEAELTSRKVHFHKEYEFDKYDDSVEDETLEDDEDEPKETRE